MDKPSTLACFDLVRPDDLEAIGEMIGEIWEKGLVLPAYLVLPWNFLDLLVLCPFRIFVQHSKPALQKNILLS